MDVYRKHAVVNNIFLQMYKQLSKLIEGKLILLKKSFFIGLSNREIITQKFSI